MLSRRLADLARSIQKAGRTLPAYIPQQAIAILAHSIADDVCTGQDRLHFLLACGVPFTL